jgi:phage shock protein A
MPDRTELIARKNEVQGKIARLRRQLEQLRQQDSPRQRRQIERLETQLEQLMAEEYRLRLAIDRSHR